MPELTSVVDRYDYFHKQRVLDTELDAGFDDCENADRALAADHALTKIVTGLGVSAQLVPADLTVRIAAGIAYDKTGRRIQVPAEITSQTVATDYLGNPTTVTIAGQERVVSIFAEFNRALSDPRTDGNNTPIDYRQAESYTIKVVSGVQSAAPATPTALDPTNILLADVRLSFGTVIITSSEIEITRREWWLAFTGTSFQTIGLTARGFLTSLSSYLDGTRTETRVVPATAAQVVVSGTGTISFADSNRTLTSLGSTEQIQVPLAVRVGEQILSVTARWNKAGASQADFLVNWIAQDLTTDASTSKLTSGAAGAQSATLSASDDPIFFPQTVTTARTYWARLEAGDGGDKFVSVEYTVRLP